VLVSAPRRNELCLGQRDRANWEEKSAMTRALSPAREARALPEASLALFSIQVMHSTRHSCSTEAVSKAFRLPKDRRSPCAS
jgi:hypothetical protein